MAVAIPEQRERRRLGLAVALFLEFHHRCIRRHFDFTIDDGALGDRHGAGGNLAANDCRVAYFQLVFDAQAAGDLAGDDCLLCLNETIPGSGCRQIQTTRQFSIAMDFAGYDELAGTANVADEHGFRADEGWGCRTGIQKPPFWWVHDGHYPYHDTL